MHTIVTTALLTGVLGLMVGSSHRERVPLVGIKPGPAAAITVVSWVRTATADDSLRAESALQATLLRPQLEVYFGRFNGDRTLVRRISRAVVREARRQQVPPSLIAAVLVTENTTLKPQALSSVGAVGLMQVMPIHAGAALCGSSDLTDVDSNICHGTLILARNLRRTQTTTAALLRYNGCVRGTNTPDCHRYPSKVLARAGKVRQQILASTNALEAEG
jgi:soluble lytic murein transglycosylase-like protein